MRHYTHGHADAVLRSHRNRTIANSAEYLLPYLNRQTTLLDIGAGPGTITVDFAAHVAHVTATEIGPAELALSQNLAAERHIANISFAVADVEALPFADDSFDLIHAHQVLQHVGDPVRALTEMHRVARPGGVVAARDADYGGFVWFPHLPELDEWRRLYSAAARSNGGEPDAGRRLLSWARQAGFTDINAGASTWCYANQADRDWWGGLWADRIVGSAIADQLLSAGLATPDDLRRICDAWHRWAAAEEGWFLVPHGEILCRV